MRARDGGGGGGSSSSDRQGNLENAFGFLQNIQPKLGSTKMSCICFES